MDVLNLADKIVTKAKKLGATSADAIAIENTDFSIAVRMGKTENIERSDSSAIGLRVFIGKQKAIVSSSDLKEESLDSIVSRAVDMAKLAPKDPHTDLADSSLFAKNIDNLELFDDYEPSAEDLIDIAKQTEDVARSVKGITNSEGADCGYGKGKISLVTSNGFSGSYESSSFFNSVSVLAGEGTAMERDYDYSSTRHFKDLKLPEEIGKKAAELALRRLNPKSAKTGSFPVIFDRRVAKSLVGTFAGSINGAAIARGTSFLKDSMDKNIFSSNINIVNDPLMVRGLSSKPFDAEGVEVEKLNIIDSGVLKHWLLDIRSANQLGLKTNGCASRGLASNPSPSSSNFYMQNGDVSPEELIGNIKSGLYVTETFGMGINTVTGDYSQGAAGFWIENGEIAYPVSEFTIAGKLQDMFANLVAANDLEFKYSINSPTLLVESMTVAGQES
ncbi:metallopeptidase TldD-related protein [Rickettsiales bacterium]|nr:metallopeptidase TldD-related protein [Rickettsiales bacterium]